MGEKTASGLRNQNNQIEYNPSGDPAGNSSSKIGSQYFAASIAHRFRKNNPTPITIYGTENTVNATISDRVNTSLPIELPRERL